MNRDELLDTLYNLWHEKDKDTAVILIGGVLTEFDRLTRESHKKPPYWEDHTGDDAT